MIDTLFRRILLPVASPDDATTTCDAVLSRLDGENVSVHAVHVIEKAGGAPDKASVEQREAYAGEVFTAVGGAFADSNADVDTEILFGTDVAETILDAADEFDASAIVFTPRGSSRWLKLFVGDTATNLIANADRPVVVLPDADEEGAT